MRVLSRSGDRSRDDVDHVSVDATDSAALTAAATGATALYNCANPPYDKWPTLWPPMAEALLTAAERSGAVLVTMGNRNQGTGPRPYVGAGAGPPPGRCRPRRRGRGVGLRRAGVTDNGLMGGRVVPRVLAGKGVRVMGDPDQSHSWTAVGDVGVALARLGADERAWGRAWHVPTAPPVTQREAVAALCRAAGVAPVPVRKLPHAVLRATGLVVPTVRELAEVRHQFTGPFVLDSSAYTAAFGDAATPLEQTWKATVDWWRGRSAG